MRSFAVARISLGTETVSLAGYPSPARSANRSISALESEGYLRHIDGGIYEILERAYDLVINKTVSPKAEGLVKMYEDQFLPRKKGVDDEERLTGLSECLSNIMENK